MRVILCDFYVAFDLRWLFIIHKVLVGRLDVSSIWHTCVVNPLNLLKLGFEVSAIIQKT